MTECGSIRYAKKGLEACSGPTRFRVSYRTSKGVETDGHPCCFIHGLAEVERHHASAGMAQCELVETIVDAASFGESASAPPKPPAPNTAPSSGGQWSRVGDTDYG